MAKVIDHVNAALQLLGLSSVIRPATPGMIDLGVEIYNDVIARWVEDGIEVGVVQSQVAGDESQVYPWAAQALQYSMAMMIAPRAQVDVSQAILSGHVELMHVMRERARLSSVVPEGRAQYDPRLPVGSGNSRGGRFSRRFYGK